uniref:Uncharacterized protein n=1 Tax=Glossina morsitans morsitans TaxID=37546 RepID=A0A1B0FF44_GLOMM
MNVTCEWNIDNILSNKKAPSYTVHHMCYKKSHLLSSTQQGGSMPNTSSSVPFLLSSSMQSIRSRRPSTVLSTGPLGSGTGLWQQLGSGMFYVNLILIPYGRTDEKVCTYHHRK